MRWRAVIEVRGLTTRHNDVLAVDDAMLIGLGTFLGFECAW